MAVSPVSHPAALPGVPRRAHRLRPLPRIFRLLLGFAAAGLPLHAQEPPGRPGEGAPPPSPDELLATLAPRSDLAVDLVLSEPEVRKPLHLSFDERGRLWVVNYLQYPDPAGLKAISRDSVWRTVYDRSPPPPPHPPGSPFRGADRITIHEDTDGDGEFDRHKTFVEGLNLATAVAHGRGGVWVMNPPYLVFYPDADRDDVPDGDPVVHLSGFWLQDTHSIANSIRWGPDGWLYGAQGSTVTADVTVAGTDDPPVSSVGQHIWRYHPGLRRYEVFAEGGGNTFGVEIDSRGDLFSGHNGGNTRGFHYVQGGYYQKTFGKHGDLSNPFAFGYFPQMRHEEVVRFTHQFCVYEGDALPEPDRGRIFGADVLNHRITVSDRIEEGATFRTTDREPAVVSTSDWFRPVHVTDGPDGALYVADWSEPNVNHWRSAQGQFDGKTGRIFRIRPKAGFVHRLIPDLGSAPPADLVDLLAHPNRWHRQTALRILADRQDREAVPPLRNLLASSAGAPALEALWTLHALGALDDDLAVAALRHRNPDVRAWTIRLLGDAREVTTSIAVALREIATAESAPRVRAQLAASCQRFPAPVALPIIDALVTSHDDGGDAFIPLLTWWAIERHAGADPASAVEWVRANPGLWDRPVFVNEIAPRLVKRFAVTGRRADYLVCAKILGVCPSDEAGAVLAAAFSEAFAGRSMSGLPDELVQAVGRFDRSAAFALRVGRPDAVANALGIAADPDRDLAERIAVIDALGETRAPGTVDALLPLLAASGHRAVHTAILRGLQSFDDAAIGSAVIAAWAGLDADARSAAVFLLAARDPWAARFLDALDAGTIGSDAVDPAAQAKLRASPAPEVAERAARRWPAPGTPAPEVLEARIGELGEIALAGGGDPLRGQELFAGRCAACHDLFQFKGPGIGPDLTSYQRDDLDSLLLALVAPSAEIREGFESISLQTRDGQFLHGFLAEESGDLLTIRSIEGVPFVVAREEIVRVDRPRVSLMPAGLLDTLTKPELRDFFAYLLSRQPPK